MNPVGVSTYSFVDLANMLCHACDVGTPQLQNLVASKLGNCGFTPVLKAILKLTKESLDNLRKAQSYLALTR